MLHLIKKQQKWLIPLFLLALFAPFSPFIDWAIASYFYEMGKGSVNHFVETPLLIFFYNYGPMAGLVTAAIAALFYFLSFLIHSLKPIKRSCLLLLLAMAIGSGFITNSILKEYWGRPRPTQVTAFGGLQHYRPFFSPNFFSQPEPSKSFPCGHASTGFYFFALAVIGMRKEKPWLKYLGFTLAAIFGIALGITRMAQGGHFFSDVVVSALVMWWTTLAFDWLIHADVQEEKFAQSY